jgi:antitoxin MazE
MDLHVAKWGNSLALRLPSDLARQIGLKEGDLVQANLTADGALALRTEKWRRDAFAAELALAREGMPLGSSVIEEMRSGARY